MLTSAEASADVHAALAANTTLRQNTCLLSAFLGSLRRQTAVGRVDPFGFSWSVPISLRKPFLRGLDFLGFPWILSSETNDINGLRGIFGGIFFLGPVSGARSRHGA
jgi:hypothetical protein